MVGSGVASMEQIEQLLPRTAKDHFCKSCKSRNPMKGLGTDVGR